MANTTPVYCSNCKYYKHCKSKCLNTYDAGNLHEQCSAPQNVRADHRSSSTDKYISCPSIINRFNNCLWFVAKEEVTSTSDETDDDTETFINE